MSEICQEGAHSYHHFSERNFQKYKLEPKLSQNENTSFAIKEGLSLNYKKYQKYNKIKFQIEIY